jgi:outer membrane protein assembly complex protein YaeT
LPLRRRDPTRVLIGLALALVLASGPAGAADDPDDLASELKTVESVRLAGRRQIPARVIWSALKTRRPGFWPWSDRPALRLDFLRADVEAIAFIYRQYGFLDARAEYRIASTRDAKRVNVVFEIDEGRRSYIATVELAGVSSYPEADLRRQLFARPGRPFNPGFLVADTARISRLYQDRGFIPHVTGEARRDSLDMHVRYDVHEGPAYRFGEVYLTSPGESRVRRDLILRELLVHEGDLFRRSRIEQSQERLYETGLFSAVQVTPLPDSTRSRIDVHLQVRERRPRWLDAGVGSGTTERFRFTGEWGHRNLAGRGLQGVVGARLAFDGRAKFLLSRGEASLLQPWLFGTRIRGIATPYLERRDDRADPRWIVGQDAKGVSFQARRELGRRGEIVLTQDNAFVRQEIEFLDPTVADSTRDSLTLNVPSRYTTHRLRLSAQREFRDNPLAPTRGSVQSVSGEVAGGPLKGTSSFNKWQVVSAWYTPFPNNWVLALRAQGGAIHPFGEGPPFSPADDLDEQVGRVPLEDRFRIGGVNSIRGFNENAIPASGGLAMTLANAELRIPVAGPFGVEMFVDAGNVWARPEYVKARHFELVFGDERLGPSDLRVVFGAGARVNLPFGPLRVDFAWSPRPDEDGDWLVAEPQFAIGPSF